MKPKPGRRLINKYGAHKTEVDGIVFDSKKEALRYSELKLLQRAGEISDLQLQPKFPLGIEDKPILIRSKGYPNGRRSVYRADFQYRTGNKTVVEDVKGMDTPVSRLKRAIVEAQYGVRVVLV